MSALEQLDKIEEYIRLGDSAKARVLLHAFLKSTDKSSAKNKKTRPHLARVTQLCRRAGIPNLGLKVLSRIVRPDSKRLVQASAEERAEYAAALTNVGASREATEILHSIPFKEFPRTLLYQALAHMNRWEYEKSVPSLEKFCSVTGPDDYFLRVGQVNLAASYLASRQLDKAQNLLRELMSTFKDKQFSLLRANVQELLAQNLIFSKNYSAAKKVLEEAAESLPDKKLIWFLYIKKWEAVIKLREGNLVAATEKLRNVQKEAQEKTIWETVRDCDLYLAEAQSSRPLFEKLYMGTPFPHYRSQLLETFEKTFSTLKDFPPTHYQWILRSHTTSKKELPYLDLENACSADATKALKFGQLPHKLLLVLAKDFYRPHRIASLHADLFPDRYFNVQSSPQVVQQHIHRLRQWFLKNKIPLEIKEHEEFYSLEARASFAIHTSDKAQKVLESSLNAKNDHFVGLLKNAFADRDFSSTQVARALKISLISAKRQLAVAYKSKSLTKLGSSRMTKYRLERQ